MQTATAGRAQTWHGSWMAAFFVCLLCQKQTLFEMDKARASLVSIIVLPLYGRGRRRQGKLYKCGTNIMPHGWMRTSRWGCTFASAINERYDGPFGGMEVGREFQVRRETQKHLYTYLCIRQCTRLSLFEFA